MTARPCQPPLAYRTRPLVARLIIVAQLARSPPGVVHIPCWPPPVALCCVVLWLMVVCGSVVVAVSGMVLSVAVCGGVAGLPELMITCISCFRAHGARDCHRGLQTYLCIH